MPYKRVPQKFNAAIGTLTLGTGEKSVAIGGEKTLPLYFFDGDAGNPARVGVEISDLGVDRNIPGVAAFYEGCETVAELAERACSMPGADFIALKMDSADPSGNDRPVDECLEDIKAVLDVITLPLVIEGCKNADKDAELFEKAAALTEGKNVLFLAAKEENYKTVAASVGLAFKQYVGAESAVDINLAKQLNVLINQLGVPASSIAMNLGSAAAGYGFEYVASTMDRVKAAALGQNDAMLQPPVITPVAGDAWSVKESLIFEEDMPEWGNQELRGINMEICTATACIACGSNAVILMHPASVATVSAFVAQLA